jgi:hypothetical protein
VDVVAVVGRKNMAIDRQVEKATRTMLGYAIRHELDDLAAVMRRVENEAYLGSAALCLLASAYIAIEACERWPTDADLREIANAAGPATRLGIGEQEIYTYLSRVALGSEKADDIFPAESVATVPLYATANLLVTFCPRDKNWWEYLDQIWVATETASRTSIAVLPALMFRAFKESVSQ